ncbi:MAG TPA: AsmA family protein [Terriglobia bacterium]|nr:AsmA family protein [Terriglobia bacterium]
MLSFNRRRVRNFTVALLLLGLAAWIVPSYFSAERYRRRLQAGLEQALHRPVRFGSLAFRLLPRPGFSIEDVEVDEDSEFGSEPFARVDHIACDLRWHSLWRSRMDFSHLHLDRPSFNIVLNSRGNWNVEKLLLQSGVTAPAGAPGGQASVAAEQLDLDVDDARINFQVGPNKKPFALTDVRARLQVNPAERRVQFEITASPVRSDLTIPTPGPVEANGTWTPGADLRGPIEARVRTRGALLYDWIPVVTGQNPQVYGVIDSDVRLTGSLPNLIVEGAINLAQLQRWEEIPPSDPMPWAVRFRGRLVRGRECVQVESLDASFADSHLHLSGSANNLQSDPQLDFVVSLERSRLEDVLAAVRRLWPNAGSWNMQGRVDAMLSIQGPWRQRRYGGYVGAREVSLETPSGSFPVSEIAMRINNHGAILAPVQIDMAPRVVLSAQGAIDRASLGLQYELQLGAKGVPLHDAVKFGRALGVHALQGIGATGSVTATLRLAGSAWPPARPTLTARAEMRAARLLIPGLTEPLNLPRASLQVTGDRIIADQVIAVMGTSVFTANLLHRGARGNPWKFDLRANRLALEQSALWFDALGLRRPLPLLDRLPGLASFAARREAAAQIFGSLNAEGRFATPSLSYRGVTLQDFQGNFEVAGRTVRMRGATFRAGGGRGAAAGAVDFTLSPPLLSARASLAGFSVQALTERLPGPVHDLHASASASGNFQTHGLAREELAENLTGQIELRMREISFGDFDPLGALAEQLHWGKLDPVRGPVTAPPTILDMEIRNRSFVLKPMRLDLSGANLRIDGTYFWAGAINLNVRADLRSLRRRWLERDEAPQPSALLPEVRLGGPIDHLVVTPQEGVARLGTDRGGERDR